MWENSMDSKLSSTIAPPMVFQFESITVNDDIPFLPHTHFNDEIKRNYETKYEFIEKIKSTSDNRNNQYFQ